MAVIYCSVPDGQANSDVASLAFTHPEEGTETEAKCCPQHFFDLLFPSGSYTAFLVFLKMGEVIERRDLSPAPDSVLCFLISRITKPCHRLTNERVLEVWELVSNLQVLYCRHQALEVQALEVQSG